MARVRYTDRATGNRSSRGSGCRRDESAFLGRRAAPRIARPRGRVRSLRDRSFPINRTALRWRIHQPKTDLEQFFCQVVIPRGRSDRSGDRDTIWVRGEIPPGAREHSPSSPETPQVLDQRGSTTDSVRPYLARFFRFLRSSHTSDSPTCLDVRIRRIDDDRMGLGKAARSRGRPRADHVLRSRAVASS
jgi:hypothetical protein